MAIYLIACEVRNSRNYDALWRQFSRWKCLELTRTTWLAELVGPATEVHKLVASHLASQDKLAVFELSYGSEWMTDSDDSRTSAWLSIKIGAL